MPSSLKNYLLVALLLTFFIPVSAQVAFTIQPVNVRAGPDRGFPLVTWLPGGVTVQVMGCLSGWRWCDVIFGRNRGWVFARYLAFSFQNQRMPIITGGPRRDFRSCRLASDPIGVPTVADDRGISDSRNGRIGVRRHARHRVLRRRDRLRPTGKAG